MAELAAQSVHRSQVPTSSKKGRVRRKPGETILVKHSFVTKHLETSHNPYLNVRSRLHLRTKPGSHFEPTSIVGIVVFVASPEVLECLDRHVFHRSRMKNILNVVLVEVSTQQELPARVAYRIRMKLLQKPFNL